MKPSGLLLFLLIFISCTNSPSIKRTQEVQHKVKKIFYSPGKLKQLISYNLDGLRDSISEYYNRDGYLDSSMNYSNGKLNGIKFYYENGGTFKNIYRSDSLIQQNWYDSTDILKYSLPVSIATVSKTRIKFSSGRDYFDTTKTDTIEFFNKGLPPFNRMVTISKGISLKHLNDSSYIIKLSPNSEALREIKVVTAIAQNFENPLSNQILFDSIYINVK